MALRDREVDIELFPDRSPISPVFDAQKGWPTIRPVSGMVRKVR
jgi:hypothetical protein